MLGGFVSVRVLTSALGPAEYGTLALIQTLAFLPPQFLYGPLAQGVTRFYSVARESGHRVELMLAALRLLGYITAATALIAFFTSAVARELVASAFGDSWPVFLLAAGLLSVVDGYSLILDGVQNAARQRIVVSWHQNLSRWGRLGLSIAFIAWWAGGALSAIWGWVAAALIVSISQTRFLVRLLGIHTSPFRDADRRAVANQVGDIIRFSLPFVVWGVFSWVQFASDRWTLQAFWGSSEVGVYAALSQIGYTPLVVFGNMMLQLISPIVFERVGDNSNSGRRASGMHQLVWAIYIVSGATVAFVIALSLLHRPIFQFLTPEPFWILSPQLPLMALAAGIFNVGQMFTVFSQALYQSRRLIAPKLGFALLNTALNILLGKLYGPNGIVLAFLASSLVYALWMGLLSRSQIQGSTK